uniref:NrdA-like ribonucleotide reductase n=1 Tax=Erwinia phage Fifi051 TaxID=3238787 RepID=A0AB39ACN6_9CAUD
MTSSSFNILTLPFITIKSRGFIKVNELLIINKHHQKVGLSERHHYIGRPSALGNPFEINHICDRIDVINAFEPWLKRKVLEKDIVVIAALDKIAEQVLDGTGLPVYLVCFCSPKPCHGDVIKQFIIRAIEGNQGK